MIRTVITLYGGCSIGSSLVVFSAYMMNNKKIQDYNPYPCKNVKTKLFRYVFNKNILDYIGYSIAIGIMFPILWFNNEYIIENPFDFCLPKNLAENYVLENNNCKLFRHQVLFTHTENIKYADWIVKYKYFGGYSLIKINKELW